MLPLIIAIAVVAILLVTFVTAPVRKRRRRKKNPSAATEIAALRETMGRSARYLPPVDTEEPSVRVLAEPVPEVPKSFRERISRTRDSFTKSVSQVFGKEVLTDEDFALLEESLIRADVGVKTTTQIIDQARVQAKEGRLTSGAQLRELILMMLETEMTLRDRSLHLRSGVTNVWLFVGVNGVGKTTTIGKVAAQQKAVGKSLILAAGDTFRAAAADQLGMWAERSDSQLVRGQEGGDPGAVIFDAVERASSQKIDLVLADTAGRLQNKSNLMNELAKIQKIASREPAVLSEVLLVIDATVGQNGLNQAREFLDVAGVTGVVLTKLDGTARGGIALAIEAELDLPVKLVGVGEGIDDLMPFSAPEYLEALLN